MEILEARIEKDDWPEYYDGERGRFVGKQARRTKPGVSLYIIARKILETPDCLSWVGFTKEVETEDTNN